MSATASFTIRCDYPECVEEYTYTTPLPFSAQPPKPSIPSTWAYITGFPLHDRQFCPAHSDVVRDLDKRFER